MFYLLDETIIRQRVMELNKRLDRLYVPADLGEETHGVRLSLPALRGWLMRRRGYLSISPNVRKDTKLAADKY